MHQDVQFHFTAYLAGSGDQSVMATNHNHKLHQEILYTKYLQLLTELNCMLYAVLQKCYFYVTVSCVSYT